MSIVAETTIGSIIAMLLQKGAKKIETVSKKKGELTIRSIGEQDELRETITIPVSREADNFSFTEIGRATTTAIVKPETPNLEFNNPRKIDSTITSFSMVPSSGFKTKGLVIITVNGVAVLKNKAAADFTDVVDNITTILRGKKIKASEKLRVFIWTSDATSSSLAVAVTFGE